MKIAMAGDHAGFAMKAELKKLLEQQGHEVTDFGPFSEEGCDLPDFIYPASLAVSNGEGERGSFIDGVGYGNVLCLGGKIIGSAIAQEIVKTWMTTDYLADNPRYTQRVDKVVAIAAKHTTK